MEQIEVKISDITLTNVGFAVFLRPLEQNDSKVVPIFIGPLETHAITSVLDGISPPRPMTHDLLMMILPILGAKIIKVTIDEIIDNTFYAKITIRRDEEIFVVDARPSDSIAIALRAGSPIYVTQNILDEAGIVMREGDFESESREDQQPQKPKTQLEVLQESLDRAVNTEDYESAARIRDQIKKIVGSS
ncbi:MAG: bifunctional nuclease family protein [Leptospiraceae bacterium]|nr:bifunctional nuclease family protein [Leptospiraceae bacterium]MCP5493789.1 bifunctional nuclease family protein [Leptospiraceae bacterium]